MAIDIKGIKINNGIRVWSLAKSIRQSNRNQEGVPLMIKHFLSPFPENDEGLKFNWQSFIIQETGEEVRHGTFAEFVTATPPRGLGTTVGKLEVWVKEELPEYPPYLKDSKIPKAGKQGRPKNNEKVDIINLKVKGGTSEEYIISRLKRDDPGLAKQVMSGEITAHAAAVKSGIRKKYVSVRCDVNGFVSKAKKIFTEEEIKQIKERL